MSSPSILAPPQAANTTQTEARMLTSLYEVQDSTFTDASVRSGDDSRLSIEPRRAAVP